MIRMCKLIFKNFPLILCLETNLFILSIILIKIGPSHDLDITFGNEKFVL